LEVDTSTNLNKRKTKEPNCLILLFYATNEGNFKCKLPLNYKPVNQRPLGEKKKEKKKGGGGEKVMDLGQGGDRIGGG